MKLNRLTLNLCLTLISLTGAAHAQLSVYGLFTYNDYTFSHSNPTAPIVSEDTAKGVTAGASYDYPVVKDLSIGLDLRGAYNSSTTGSTGGTASAKFTYSPRDSIPRLYVQVGVGDLHVTTPSTPSASYPQTSATVDSKLFQYIFGFDIQCQHGIDIRLLEVALSNNLGKATGSNLGVTPIGYSFGLVYYIPHTSKKRRYYD